MSDVTLPASRVDFLDPRTGKVSADWYRFFQQSFVRIGGPEYSISVTGSGLNYAAGEFTINSTPSNTPSTIVYRDAAGDFSAGTISAELAGNASTSTKWATARTLSFSGDVTGSGGVDGSSDIDTVLTISDTAVTAGTYGSATRATVFTVDAQGRLTAASDALITPAWSSITSRPTTATGYGISSIDNVPIGAATQNTGAFTTLSIKEGANAKQGTAVLVAGTVTVANTSVTANSRIHLTGNIDGGAPGWQRVSARIVGTSFTITSSSATDTSTIAYLITEPA